MSRCRVTPSTATARGGLGPVMCLNILLLLALTVLSAGCGGEKSEEELVIASVGDFDVTKFYYERKLANMNEDELPRDETGELMDTATMEGKRKFLRAVINKELMAQKAIDLGYRNDPQVEAMYNQMLTYNMGYYLNEDNVRGNLPPITDEELAAQYEKYQTARKCSYLITNFRDDALEARQKILDGDIWDDVAAEYNQSYDPPDGRYRITLAWGQAEDSFEDPIFSVEVGGITEPIETIYGWWIVRVDEVLEERTPDFEQMKVAMLRSMTTRQIRARKNIFIDSLYERYNMVLDEDVLWIAFQGLPEGERILDPATGKPTAKEQLSPMEVPVEDLDRVLYSYDNLDGDNVAVTLGDYKVRFDKASVFKRPKVSEMLGGMRQKLRGNINELLAAQEARRQKYDEDPRVELAIKEKVEEMMVTKLYRDVIQVPDYVSPEEATAFYEEHKEVFFMPETRDIRIIECADEATAAEAWQRAAAGEAWTKLVEEYESAPATADEEGRILGVREDMVSATRDAVFALESVGELGEPFQNGPVWSFVTLTAIHEPRQREQTEVTSEIGHYVRAQKKNEMLDGLLEEWSTTFPVVINDEELAQVRSWEELKFAMTPEGQGYESVK